MASSYPAGFDAMSDPGTNLSGPPTHASIHNQVNDVVEAIEAELGLNPSGNASTVAARFTNYRARRASNTGSVVTTSGTTVAVVCSVTLPATGVPGAWIVSGTLLVSTTAGGTTVEMNIDDGTNQFAAARIYFGAVGVTYTLSATGTIVVSSGAAVACRMTLARLVGTGDTTTVADGRHNRIDAIFVAD